MSLNPFELPELDSLADLLPAFEFDSLIAQGGMGAVYKARQRSLDREVAIKILPRELGEDPIFRSSFQAEAKAMARLTHPNLIRVYDSGDLNGLLYIVMEYVPGKSLFHSAHGVAIEPQQAVGIIIAACRGLAHAHENGIIHRDIKPANILLTPKCEPKIGDFGLARCTRTDADGLAMGTPGYMAPEVMDHPATGNPQSDVFAIGVVLRELLTGIPAGTGDAAMQEVSDSKLAAICQNATHPDPAVRYADVSALAEQLTGWMAAKSLKTVVATGQPGSHRPRPAMHQPKAAMHQARPAMHQPRPATHRPKLARLPSRRGAGKWVLFKDCATIAVLLCAILFTWGLYQTDLGSVALQPQQQGAKPRQPLAAAESKAAARSTGSRDLVTAPSKASQESSLESLVRFGTALVSGGQGQSEGSFKWGSRPD